MFIAPGDCDDAEGDELGPDDLAHVRVGDDPLRGVGHGIGDILQRVPAVGLLRDAVEQLGDLQEMPITLDEPLSILKRRLLHFANELNVRLPFGILSYRRRHRNRYGYVRLGGTEVR
jgi:hypothetical protein